MGKYVENKDYELISDENINEVWNVRILEGEYNEVVIRYGSIRVDGKTPENDEELDLHFDFEVISAPDEDLTAEDIGLQLAAGDLLYSILESSIENKEETGENSLSCSLISENQRNIVSKDQA